MVGWPEGCVVGWSVGLTVGCDVGIDVGRLRADKKGEYHAVSTWSMGWGKDDGDMKTYEVGRDVGRDVGRLVGWYVGLGVGCGSNVKRRRRERKGRNEKT